ncbi:MAG: AAA family ATPase [Gammaproteobacteria bacterium]
MTNTPIFTQFTHYLLGKDAKKTTPSSLKDHPQIPFIIDTLSRRERHHLILINPSSEKINRALLESLALQLSGSNITKTLRDCSVVYFDTTRFSLASINKEELENEFNLLCDDLKTNHKRMVFALSESDFLFQEIRSPLLASFNQLLKSMLTNDSFRLIIFTRKQNLFAANPVNHLMTTLQLTEPSAHEFVSLLKSCQMSIEQFHQVIISDETFASAYSLATQYLAHESCFDKALELLDSAAARASMTERNDYAGHKGIVSTHLLAQIVSNWTQIPLTHLQHGKFLAHKFVDAVAKQIFGQEAALNLIAAHLQNAGIKLQQKSGPICHFLFLGSSEIGKTETAFAIADYLFNHNDALLTINLTETSYASLAEIKAFTRKDEKRCVNFLSHVKQTPYTIVLLENIDHTSRQTLDLFNEIFTQGYALDEHGHSVDFRHTIVIMTTRLGSQEINNLVATCHTEETSKTVDLMQLVLNEHVQEPSHQDQTNLSIQEINSELIPKLIEHFSSVFLQHVHVVPFVPLEYLAFEKIIRLKLKVLAKRLDNQFSIELNFAPEVIKFLAHEAYWRKTETTSFEKILEQHLYSCVSHEVLVHAEEKNKSKRLLVQLNENGQRLRCEFVVGSGVGI